MKSKKSKQYIVVSDSLDDISLSSAQALELQRLGWIYLVPDQPVDGTLSYYVTAADVAEEYRLLNEHISPLLAKG